MLNNVAGLIGVPTVGFSPSQLAGLKAWYDASDTATISVSGTAVTQWNDKSTSGFNLTQGTAANRPTSGVSTQNGKNIITADGNDWLTNATASNWTFMNNGTIYLVCAAVRFGNTSNPDAAMALLDNTKFNATNQGVAVAFDDRAALPRNNAVFHYVPGASDSLNTFNLSADNFMTPNTFSVLTLRADPTNGTVADRSFLYNGTSAAQKNNAISNGVDGLAPNFGMNFLSDANGTTNLTGAIAEIVIVSGSDATDANRIKIRDYLQTKWAI